MRQLHVSFRDAAPVMADNCANSYCVAWHYIYLKLNFCSVPGKQSYLNVKSGRCKVLAIDIPGALAEACPAGCVCHTQIRFATDTTSDAVESPTVFDHLDPVEAGGLDLAPSFLTPP